MLFRPPFQEYTVESFSTETLSSCESKDGPITIYLSLKGEILKVFLFEVFPSFSRRRRVFCQFFVQGICCGANGLGEIH